ncbi:MAG: nitroreductase family deazaflavin-dependent oxidoreductase [Acidimicrobiia bacterium]
MNDFNQQIIDEFRANGGKVGGPFKGAHLLLLHTTGAKSGQERVAPLAYRKEGDGLAVFGSKAGAHTHPDWYHNVLANPDVTVEVGTEEFSARARVAEGEERDRIWEAQKRDIPYVAEYEQKTDRQIPVIVLERS